MSFPVITIRPDADAASAAAILTTRRLHHLVVADGESVVGVVSDRDLVLADGRSRIDAVMWRRVPTIESSATLRDAAAKLNDPDTECVVVLDGTRLAGVVTNTDIVRAISHSCSRRLNT